MKLLRINHFSVPSSSEFVRQNRSPSARCVVARPMAPAMRGCLAAENLIFEFGKIPAN